MKSKITSQRFPLSLSLSAARRTDAEGQTDHYQPVVVVAAHHCFGSCIYARGNEDDIRTLFDRKMIGKTTGAARSNVKA